MASTPLVHEVAFAKVTNSHHDAIHSGSFSVFLLCNTEIAIDPVDHAFLLQTLLRLPCPAPSQSLLPALASLLAFQVLGSLVRSPFLLTLQSLSKWFYSFLWLDVTSILSYSPICSFQKSISLECQISRWNCLPDLSKEDSLLDLCSFSLFPSQMLSSFSPTSHIHSTLKSCWLYLWLYIQCPNTSPSHFPIYIISCLISSILLLRLSAECSLENVNQTISEQYTCSPNTSVASHGLRIKFSIPHVALRAWQETASACFCNCSSGTFLSCSLPCSHPSLCFQFLMVQHSWPPQGLGTLFSARYLIPVHPFGLDLNVTTPNLIPVPPLGSFTLSIHALHLLPSTHHSWWLYNYCVLTQY